MNTKFSVSSARRGADLVQHRVPSGDGCGKPEAPSLVVNRFSTKEFSFLQDLVESNPRGVVHSKQSVAQLGTKISMPGHPPVSIDPQSQYGVMTPGPVNLRGVRFVPGQQSALIGIGGGNTPGVTVVLVDRRNRQKEEDFYVLHVSTDAYDAGLHLQDQSATLITLRPNSAEVWFFGEKPVWADAMLARETSLVKFRKLTWPISKTEQALMIGVTAVLLAALFVRVELTPRF